MPNEPTLEGANLPTKEWNPPGGDQDFNDLFGGAGDGSTDVVQVEEALSASVESTTETPSVPATEPQAPKPASEPTQTTLTQDPSGKFRIVTKTGTVYDSLEDAQNGIAEKDTTISNLRKMVEAVTGQDPLKKGGQQPQPEISYLEDANRYAQDLERTAEYGQRTKDWRPYRDVQMKLQWELIQQTVGRYAPVVQKASRQEVLDSIESEIPGFKSFYGTEQYRQALESRPKLKQAIEYAENNPDSDLKELLSVAWDVNQSRRLPDLLKQPPSNPTPTPARMPMSQGTLTAPRVVTERPGGHPQNPLSNSAARKAYMAEMEAKGILDRPI